MTGQPASHPAALRRLGGVLERNPFTILMLGAWGAERAYTIRDSLVSDAWFTLLAGRTISGTGLPQHDALTVLAAGRRWVDQQWLAHLMFYGLWKAGGWPLALLAVAVFFTGAFVVLAASARLLGASDRSVALVVAFCFAAGLPNTAMRAQIPAYLLFALVFALLLADERKPSRRVLLVLPLIVVWANIHGSVVLGAGLVSLRGLTAALTGLRARAPARGWAPRAGTLLAAPWLCTLVSPYGLALPAYYRRVLDNPTLARTVTEWGPANIRNQPVFYLVLIVGLWLVFRSRAALGLFARVAFLVAAFAGLLAIRNIVWFAFVATATLPGALDELWASRETERRARLNITLALLGVLGALAGVAATAHRSTAWFEHAYPRQAAAAVARATDGHPGIRVFATEEYADWLLFVDPALTGRVAYDIRFELLTSAQLDAIHALRTETGLDWLRAANGYRVLVLNPGNDKGAVRLIERQKGTVVLFRSSSVVALERSSPLTPT